MSAIRVPLETLIGSRLQTRREAWKINQIIPSTLFHFSFIFLFKREMSFSRIHSL